MPKSDLLNFALPDTPITIGFVKPILKGYFAILLILKFKARGFVCQSRVNCPFITPELVFKSVKSEENVMTGYLLTLRKSGLLRCASLFL